MTDWREIAETNLEAAVCERRKRLTAECSVQLLLDALRPFERAATARNLLEITEGDMYQLLLACRAARDSDATRRAETTGSVGEADGGPTPKGGNSAGGSIAKRRKRGGEAIAQNPSRNHP